MAQFEQFVNYYDSHDNCWIIAKIDEIIIMRSGYKNCLIPQERDFTNLRLLEESLDLILIII